LFQFDNVTGAYNITITATSTLPFLGGFRLNFNLFNIDTLSFFGDTGNDFNLATASTTVALTGVSASLIGWQLGHRIAVNSGGTSGATTGSFGSGVLDQEGGVFVGQDRFSTGNQFFGNAADFAIVRTPVPEPATLLLLGAGLGLAGVRRRFKHRG
jgi:hypothetical protein